MESAGGALLRRPSTRAELPAAPGSGIPIMRPGTPGDHRPTAHGSVGAALRRQRMLGTSHVAPHCSTTGAADALFLQLCPEERISTGRCCPVAGRHRRSHAKIEIEPKGCDARLALQPCANRAVWQSAGAARRISEAIQAGQHEHASCDGESNYFLNDLAYSSSRESAAEVRASSFDVSAAKSERRRNSLSPTTLPRAKTFLTLADFLSTKNSKLKP